jgi:hypothetical protein
MEAGHQVGHEPLPPAQPGVPELIRIRGTQPPPSISRKAARRRAVVFRRKPSLLWRRGLGRAALSADLLLRQMARKCSRGLIQARISYIFSM